MPDKDFTGRLRAVEQQEDSIVKEQREIRAAIIELQAAFNVLIDALDNRFQTEDNKKIVTLNTRGQLN